MGKSKLRKPKNLTRNELVLYIKKNKSTSYKIMLIGIAFLFTSLTSSSHIWEFLLIPSEHSGPFTLFCMALIFFSGGFGILLASIQTGSEIQRLRENG